MHHSLPLITTLAIALGMALMMGFIATRLKLPTLVGYLLAGIIIGPFTPGVVANMQIAQELAEIGVMLLMFGVGLHFSLNDLLEVRKVALPGAIVQIAVATSLGASLALMWGWGLGEALVFGLALSVASTVVLLKALEERGVLESVNGRIAIGWLIVEDLFMVIALVLLPPLSHWLGGGHGGGQHLGWVFLFTLIKIATFIVLMLLVGRRFVPKLLWQIARTGSRELFTLCVVASAVGIAYGASRLFGVSFALGAFFAGMIMRESKFSQRAAEESLPLRDAFAVLFFVSVGMLFNPVIVIEQPLQVLTVLGIIVIGKSIAAFVLVLAFRYSFSSASIVSASLAQIGEFSFILAELGVRLNLLPVEGRSFILAGALISIAINPLVFQMIEPIQRWAQRFKLTRLCEHIEDPLAELPVTTHDQYLSGHVVLVGYGRVGKNITQLLLKEKIPFVVADDNRELIEKLRIRGIAAVCGDASTPSVLVQAHIAEASMFVIALSDTFNVRQMIRSARSLNPDMEIVIRTHNEDDADLLRQEGAGKIFLVEKEIAKTICHYVLTRFGK